jgi:hypothetical protein
MEASEADSAPTRGAPGSLTASLRAAPASPLRGNAPLARRTAPRDPSEESASAVETAPEAEAVDAPAEMDDASASVAGDATRPSRDVPAGPPPAAPPAAPPPAEPAPSPDVTALAAENARLRAELDATSAALADAVASRFSAERALEVASRTHTHYGRMATGRAVVVTREVADDLRNAIEDQRRETHTLRREHERLTRSFADARRAHAVELEALREALDDAIAETARANMERDVARLKRLDEDEAERARRDAPDAPLPPKAQALVDELRVREKEALQTSETALTELANCKAAFESFKTHSNDAARSLAETHAAEMSTWRAKSDAEIDVLKKDLRDAESDAEKSRDELRALVSSSSERDELLAETLLRLEALELELDRATRALRRRGALVPTPEAEAEEKENEAAVQSLVSEKNAENSSDVSRVAALEARVRRLTKQMHLSAGMHERAVAALRAEHFEVSKSNEAESKRLVAELEARTVAERFATRRAKAFEKALRDRDATAAVALAAATDAEETLLASLSDPNDPVSRVVFQPENENGAFVEKGNAKSVGAVAARSRRDPSASSPRRAARRNDRSASSRSPPPSRTDPRDANRASRGGVVSRSLAAVETRESREPAGTPPRRDGFRRNDSYRSASSRSPPPSRTDPRDANRASRGGVVSRSLASVETRESREPAGTPPRDAAADGRKNSGEKKSSSSSTTDPDANDHDHDRDAPLPPLDFSGLPAAVKQAFVSRLRSLESRVARREKHWAGVVREVHAAHAEETARARRACVAAVETKNAQIKTFREKLNAIAIAAHEQRLLESGVALGGEER